MVLVLPTLLGISIVTFVLLRLIPGDPAQVMLGEHATADQTARFRARQGLDQPIPLQYARYLWRVLSGDWGRSIVTNLPVTAELRQRLPATIELSIGAMLVACVAGIPAGVAAAQRQGSALDAVIGGGTLVGASVPLYWLGLLLGHLFGYRWGWLPPSGRLSVEVGLQPLDQTWLGGWAVLRDVADLLSGFYLLRSLLTLDFGTLIDALRHLVLPSLTLGTVPLAAIARLTRTGVLSVLHQDHVRTARAKGLSERAVLSTHVLRNASPLLLTVVGLQFGSLLSGAVLTETIYSWPGMGQLVVDRVLARDYPTVQGLVLASALLATAIGLTVDVGCTLLDPRIRHE
jgi:peptide/nickel transport system permease protein